MASWTKHPILKLPTKGQLSKLLEEKGAQAVHEVWKAREDAIKLSNENPLYHGFTLEGWVYADEMLQHYDTLMCFGGNRSGKTEFGARAVVKAAIENPNSIIVCFAQDNDASIRIQQAAIYRYLPPEFKEKQNMRSS